LGSLAAASLLTHPGLALVGLDHPSRRGDMGIAIHISFKQSVNPPPLSLASLAGGAEGSRDMPSGGLSEWLWGTWARALAAGCETKGTALG